MKKIAIASDHAGFKLKEVLKKYLESKGYIIKDFGTFSGKMVDYPDFIIPAAESVAKKENDIGIVIGGSGNGESIAANKVKGIRCALCWNKETARLAKEHNNANLISLGARLITEKEATLIVNTWLKSTFKKGRHLRRIKKISEYENLFKKHKNI
jgi:ribose 5-phosphate isomerase B